MERYGGPARATLEERPAEPIQVEKVEAPPRTEQPAQPRPDDKRLKLENSSRSGASWFFWLAALSLVNSIIAISGGDWAFLFGLAATQVVDGIVLLTANEAGTIPVLAKLIGFGVNISIAGLFVLFGVLARRRYSSIFILGIVAYSVDAVVILLVQDYLATAFHAWVLISLTRGLQSCRKLNQLDEAVSAG